MTSEAQGILQKLRQERTRLFERYGLLSMAVFGSTVRSDHRAASDVDIMVELGSPIGLDFVTLADELEQLLGRKVDLVSKRSIKPRYMVHIEPDLQYV